MSQPHDTTYIQKELIENKTLHIAAIDYALMPKFETTVKNIHANQTLVIDQSSNKLLVKMAEYLLAFEE